MEIRTRLMELLGDLPPFDRTIRALERRIVHEQGYQLETCLLDLNGLQDVPAYIAIPDHVTKPPVVIYNHSHGGFYDVGKEELIQGAPYLQKPYLNQLMKMGIAVIAIDHWAFGKRNTRSEQSIFKEMLWDGRSMWGMMLYDSIRAIDFLELRDDLDTARLATLGMSMGGTHAWWLAALDERIKLCIDLCGSADYRDLVANDGLRHHGIYYYVPGLRKEFEAEQIQSLIAPRMRLSLIGDRDELTPGTAKIDRYLKQIYADQNASANYQYHSFPAGHQETPEMRKMVIEALKLL